MNGRRMMGEWVGDRLRKRWNSEWLYKVPNGSGQEKSQSARDVRGFWVGSNKNNKNKKMSRMRVRFIGS